MDYWYTFIDDLDEISCSINILNASSFMIKAHRFGTMTYTEFLPFLIKRLLKWLSMENGTLNTYRISSVSLSEVPQKSITVIIMPSFFDYNYQTYFQGQSSLSIVVAR